LETVGTIAAFSMSLLLVGSLVALAWNEFFLGSVEAYKEVIKYLKKEYQNKVIKKE
jgi:hypothetical protein